MGYNLKTALSAAALALGLAASPAFAQMFGAPASGGVMAGGGFGGGHGGGFGGGRVGAQVYAPQFQGPAAIPRAYVPQGLPGGGIVAPRVHPQVGGSNWATGGVAIAPQRPRVWSPRGVVAAPHDTAQSMYVGGRHRHRGGHWRGGAAYPAYVGGYDPYPVYVPPPVYETYADDEEYCVMRKVRVHTRHGWRRVWRRVCT